MRKLRQLNIRTVIPNGGEKHAVKDQWPPRSYTGKYVLASRVLTRVVVGEIYVEEYIPGKTPTTTIRRAGSGFVQHPDVVYAIGSVYGGAETISFSHVPINPLFITQPDENE